jgi:high-affinity nickel permease
VARGPASCYPHLVLDTGSVLLATLAGGFALGMVHALDADHLVAVSALVSERPAPGRSSLVGLAWGLGHATALGAGGVAVVLLGRAVPAALGAGFELAVALMLVMLGVQAVRRGLASAALHRHLHAHDGAVHAHRHLHVHGLGRHEGLLHALAHAGRRPFAVGLVHGLAGSAALSLVVLAAIPTPGLALAYVAVFGVGSIGGMALVSGLVAVPLAAATQGALRRLQVGIGAAGVAFGCVLAVRIVTG